MILRWIKLYIAQGSKPEVDVHKVSQDLEQLKADFEKIRHQEAELEKVKQEMAIMRTELLGKLVA